MLSIKSDQIAAMDKYYRVMLINSLVFNKSLNLLGTVDKENTSNLCLIGSAFSLCANPPLLGLVTKPADERHDTLDNIRLSGHFTLNNVLPEFFKTASQTGPRYFPRVSEINNSGLKVQYIDGFKAPFVRQSTVRIGLELREIINMKINDSIIVIGQVVEIITDDSIIGPDGTVNHIKAESMTAYGLDTYHLPRAVARLVYAKPGIEQHEFSILN